MTLNELVERVLKDTNYFDNPYFVNLRNRTFDKTDFIETQIQFYYAVIFFSRPMAALAAKIPTPELRLEVLRNVWEEHGEGSLTQAHGKTFLEFLRRIGGVSPEDVFCADSGRTCGFLIRLYRAFRCWMILSLRSAR